MTKYLTQEGLEKLKKELENLEKVERREVSKSLEEAIAQGDLSENAGYEVAKERQAFVESRISELKDVIAQVNIIEKTNSKNIGVGSFVALESEKESQEYQIVGSEEADILEGKISFESPLGKAILNKKKGDVVKFETPDGQKEYKIVEVK